MTTAQVVETSITVNNNSSIQDYVHPDDQTQPTFYIYMIACYYSNNNKGALSSFIEDIKPAKYFTK